MTVSGKVTTLDGENHQIILADGTIIPIDDVRFIKWRLFDAMRSIFSILFDGERSEAIPR